MQVVSTMEEKDRKGDELIVQREKLFQHYIKMPAVYTPPEDVSVSEANKQVLKIFREYHSRSAKLSAPNRRKFDDAVRIIDRQLNEIGPARGEKGVRNVLVGLEILPKDAIADSFPSVVPEFTDAELNRAAEKLPPEDRKRFLAERTARMEGLERLKSKADVMSLAEFLKRREEGKKKH